MADSVQPGREADAPSKHVAAGPPSAGRPADEREALERALSRAEGDKWRRRVLIVLGVIGLVAAIGLWRVKTRPRPPAKYVTAETSHGDVLETVQSTGQVKPTTEVQVGAQVSGRITKVYVDFNSRVKAGDLLAEIDPTLFGAQIESTKAQMAVAAANVTSSDANLTTTKQRVTRAKKLAAEGLASQADVDTAQGAYEVALAEVAASKAQVAQVGAQLKGSKTNLDYTRIESPIDGIVINRAIDPGQTVAASFQAPVLFVIAQDLSKMRVLADVDEADVGRLREGMAAKISVDAFPGEGFMGLVKQVRYNPVAQSGVVTYAAVIEVDNAELKLRPGMTATVTITSSEARNVIRIPNAALRYKPSPPEKDGKKVVEEPLPPLPPKKARIWIITDARRGKEKAEPRLVDIGITDGVNTELMTDIGPIKVVTDETDDESAKKGRGPRMF